MRLELFFKTAGELQALLALVRQTGIGAVNLVNKAKGDPIIDQIRTIKGALPDVDVVPHFSFKHQYRSGSAEATYEAAHRFCSAAAAEGAREVLLVNGSGPKRQMDPVACLERFAEERNNTKKKKKRPRSPLDDLTFGVAFNPYLPDDDEEDGGKQAEERRRLKAKLATGLVSSVWLQMGDDAGRLRQGLEFLRAEAAGIEPPLRVVGSLAVPSRKFLAMMKFRPWGGVSLSDDYLSSVEAADARTRAVLDVYREFDVEPIVETAVKSEEDLARVKELTGDDLFFSSSPSPSEGRGKGVGGQGEEGKTTTTKRARSG